MILIFGCKSSGFQFVVWIPDGFIASISTQIRTLLRIASLHIVAVVIRAAASVYLLGVMLFCIPLPTGWLVGHGSWV